MELFESQEWLLPSCLVYRSSLSLKAFSDDDSMTFFFGGQEILDFRRVRSVKSCHFSAPLKRRSNVN
jgi:hypothetical protein